MLDFTTQKRLLEPILKNPKNHHCADCDSISPTWASLDFGVFLCSNCSGAHRGLGPTITRVRSANLDKWQEEWLANMLIGNSELNLYWESDPRSADKKPTSGSTLNEIARYVYEKYVKRKFVKEAATPDPLTLLKKGEYQISNATSDKAAQSKPKQTSKPLDLLPPPPASKTVPPTKKAEVSLLEFDFEPVHQTPVTTQPVHNSFQMMIPTVTNPVVQPNVNPHEQDLFTEFTEVGSTHTSQLQKNTDANFISFDALLNQQSQAPQTQHNYNSYNSLKTQNIQLHHQYNQNLGQHNLVYQSHFQQPSFSKGYSMPHHGYPAQMPAGSGLYGQVNHHQVPQIPQFWG